MPRITATVDEEVERKARAKAALEGRSLPDVVRELLRRYIEDGLPGYEERDANDR